MKKFVYILFTVFLFSCAKKQESKPQETASQKEVTTQDAASKESEAKDDTEKQDAEEPSENNKEEQKNFVFTTGGWDGEMSHLNILKVILEQNGYSADIKVMTSELGLKAVASGDADLNYSWLPSNAAIVYESVKDKVDKIGAVYKGGLTGLVVPSYMDIDSIEDLKDPEVQKKIENKIIGIQAGSNLMASTDSLLKDMGIDNVELVYSNTAAMLSELQEAVENKRWIVTTLWRPHWIFLKNDLKFLKDPDGKYFGKGDNITALSRKGLKESNKFAYNLFSKFNLGDEEYSKLILADSEGKDPYETAKQWVSDHPDEVKSWITE